MRQRSLTPASWSLFHLQEKIDSKNLQLANNATLVIKGSNLTIEGLNLEGALVVDLESSASLTIKNAKIKNRSWSLQPGKEGPGKRPATEEEQIRYVRIWNTHRHNIMIVIQLWDQVFPYMLLVMLLTFYHIYISLWSLCIVIPTYRLTSILTMTSQSPLHTAFPAIDYSHLYLPCAAKNCWVNLDSISTCKWICPAELATIFS